MLTIFNMSNLKLGFTLQIMLLIIKRPQLSPTLLFKQISQQQSEIAYCNFAIFVVAEKLGAVDPLDCPLQLVYCDFAIFVLIEFAEELIKLVLIEVLAGESGGCNKLMELQVMLLGFVALLEYLAHLLRRRLSVYFKGVGQPFHQLLEVNLAVLVLVQIVEFQEILWLFLHAEDVQGDVHVKERLQIILHLHYSMLTLNCTSLLMTYKFFWRM